MVGRQPAWLRPSPGDLNFRDRRLVLELVRTLRERGVIVVFISHNMQQVLEVCTRAVVMRHGAVAADVAVSDVSARDLVEFITGSR